MFDPIYLTFNIAGALCAVILFLGAIIFVRDSNINKVKAVVVFALSAIFAVVAAYALNYITQPQTHNLLFKNTIGLAFSYFFCVGFLFLFALLIMPLFRLNTNTYINAAVPAVVLLSIVSRIGCIYTGCCGGITLNGIKIPTAQIECAAAVILFIALQFFIKKNRLAIYLLVYAPLRFTLEFFRVKIPSIIFFGILTPNQMYAIIVVLFVTALSLVRLRGRKHEKN